MQNGFHGITMLQQNGINGFVAIALLPLDDAAGAASVGEFFHGLPLQHTDSHVKIAAAQLPITLRLAIPVRSIVQVSEKISVSVGLYLYRLPSVSRAFRVTLPGKHLYRFRKINHCTRRRVSRAEQETTAGMSQVLMNGDRSSCS
jgi:hypothetical protein